MFGTILIVDGDLVHKDQLKKSIAEKLKYKTLAVSSVKDALEVVFTSNQSLSLVLLDMHFDKRESLQMIRSIKLKKPDLPIITLVEYGNHAHALESIESGANDFLAKPFTIERLGLSIANAIRIVTLCNMVRKMESEIEEYKMRIAQPAPYSVINSSPFGRDLKIKKLRHLEEDAIRFALNICGGSMSKAARSLGIGRSTLYRKVGELERYKDGGVLQGQILRENQTTRPTMVTSEMEHS